jgi:hypothetical protein
MHKEIQAKLKSFVDVNSVKENIVKAGNENLSTNLDLYHIFSHVMDDSLKNLKVFSCDIDRFKKWFNLEDDCFKFVDSFYDKKLEPVLAGGKLVDLLLGKKFLPDENDVDFFFLSEQSRVDVEDYLNKQIHVEVMFDGELTSQYDVKKDINIKQTADFNHVSEYDYVYNDMTYKLQIIKKEHAFVDEILENFDIRACAIAYFHGRIYWLKGALKDIKYKKINFITIRRESYTSYLRIIKYVKKGFTVSTGNMLLTSIQMLQFLLDGRGSNKEELFSNTQFEPSREEMAEMSYEELIEMTATERAEREERMEQEIERMQNTNLERATRDFNFATEYLAEFNAPIGRQLFDFQTVRPLGFATDHISF